MDQPESGNFERISRENENSPLSLRAADLAIQKKEFSRAIGILNKLIAERPAFPALYILLGKAYAGEKDFKNALVNFRQASELLNSSQTYQFYLREIEQLQKQQEENNISGSLNTDDFRSLLQTDEPKQAQNTEPKDIDDYLISETLANIYLTQGEIAEAVKVYQKLIKKHPLKKLYYESRIKDITSS